MYIFLSKPGKSDLTEISTFIPNIFVLLNNFSDVFNVMIPATINYLSYHSYVHMVTTGICKYVYV